MEMWDLFICHASEDKITVARPLAEALQVRGLKVWYDEFSLTLGDSLRRSIDAGLAHSRFGIVILSSAFFAKEWPQKELDGLVAREASGRKVVLPIWHGISRDDVVRRSPMLADKLAADTSQGIDAVADRVFQVVGVQGPNLLRNTRNGEELSWLRSTLRNRTARLIAIIILAGVLVLGGGLKLWRYLRFDSDQQQETTEQHMVSHTSGRDTFTTQEGRFVINGEVVQIAQKIIDYSYDNETTDLRSFYNRLPSGISYKTLVKLSPMRIFLSGPHSKDIEEYSEKSFGHYNPEFLSWLNDHLTAVLSNTSFIKTTSELFRMRLGKVALMYWQVYNTLGDHSKSLTDLVNAYQVGIRRGGLPTNWCHDLSWAKGKTDISFLNVLSVKYTEYDIGFALYFWVRRHIDGTDKQIYSMIDTLLKSYRIVPIKNE